jgi:phosphoribosylanthranilate isomerase
MNTNRTPYIGVTAFMNRDQVEDALWAIPSNTNRKLMIGVLASSTTLSELPNKLPGRFPPINSIRDIFIDHPLAFNVVHYASHARTTIAEQLVRIVALAPELIHGIQLNMVWPDPDAIALFKKTHPDVQIILQVGTKAFDEIGRDKDQLHDRLKTYEHIIDYVLLDDSGGYGKQMDTQFLIELMRKLKASGIDMHIVVAGGLSSSNLSLLEPIIDEFPDVSIDAEGNLRDHQKDCLDMDLVRKYIVIAEQYFTVVLSET